MKRKLDSTTDATEATSSKIVKSTTVMAQADVLLDIFSYLQPDQIHPNDHPEASFCLINRYFANFILDNVYKLPKKYINTIGVLWQDHIDFRNVYADKTCPKIPTERMNYSDLDKNVYFDYVAYFKPRPFDQQALIKAIDASLTSHGPIVAKEVCFEIDNTLEFRYAMELLEKKLVVPTETLILRLTVNSSSDAMILDEWKRVHGLGIKKLEIYLFADFIWSLENILDTHPEDVTMPMINLMFDENSTVQELMIENQGQQKPEDFIIRVFKAFSETKTPNSIPKKVWIRDLKGHIKLDASLAVGKRSYKRLFGENFSYSVHHKLAIFEKVRDDGWKMVLLFVHYKHDDGYMTNDARMYFLGPNEDSNDA